MKDIATAQEKGLLDEFAVEEQPKSKLVDAVTVASGLYLLFILVDFVIDISSGLSRLFDWQLATAILFLPATGMIFHLWHKKLGWVINTFYYLGMTIIVGFVFV